MNVLTSAPRSNPTSDPRGIDTYDARELVKDGVQACIVLDGQAYYLRITRSGKLILTK